MTSTESSVYLIGGWGNPSKATIAKYSNDKWSKLGNLKQGRSYHGAVQHNGQVMIIGGKTYDKNE